MEGRLSGLECAYVVGRLVVASCRSIATLEWLDSVLSGPSTHKTSKSGSEPFQSCSNEFQLSQAKTWPSELMACCASSTATAAPSVWVTHDERLAVGCDRTNGLVAAAIPACSAARMDPGQAIRSGDIFRLRRDSIDPLRSLSLVFERQQFSGENSLSKSAPFC